MLEGNVCIYNVDDEEDEEDDKDVDDIDDDFHINSP